MKTLHIINTLENGGAQSVLMQILEGLNEEKNSQLVITFKEQNQLSAKVEALGIPVKYIHPKKIVKLIHIIRAYQPDVVQTWLYHSNLIGSIATRLAGRIPIVWGIHHTISNLKTLKPLTVMIVRILSALSYWIPARIIGCSESAHQTHLMLGYSKKKWIIIPNGVDTLRFQPNSSARQLLERELGLKHDIKLIGMFARYHLQKDYQNLIRAAGIMIQENPAIHFVVAGAEVESSNQQLMAWIVDERIQNNIHLLGNRNDMPILLAAMDIVTLTSSHGEALPQVLGEAMACGVPCVATNIGDIAELIGDIGIVVEAKNPPALANAWLKIVSLPVSEYNDLCFRARKKVLEFYNSKDMINRYKFIYQDVIRNNEIYKSANWLSKPKNLWLVVFVYTILTGLFVQLILLPYILPTWHAENGLIKKMDGGQFHMIALGVYKNIEAQGWGAWELTPGGQLVSGIAAFCYALIYPMPWSVLPVNALLNASACVCFYFFMLSFIEDHQKALLASFPFIFFPSNLLWNTQFHNENYAIPGVIFILYGWVLITNKKEEVKTSSLREFIFAQLLIASGSLLLGLVRSYILSGMVYLYIVADLALIIYWLVMKTQRQEFFRRTAYIFFASISMLSILFLLHSFEFKNSIAEEPATTITLGIDQSSVLESKPKRKWIYSSWLPFALDEQLRMLAKKRGGFVRSWSEAGSSIDLDITFQNAHDMVVYIPRALQISLLSPFPNAWLIGNKRPTSSGMRLASGVEMLFAYFCLLGLPAFIWTQRKSPPFWVTLFVCVCMLIMYAMIIPNIGSLYRFRYPYYMPLICFGLAGWLSQDIQTKLLSLLKKNP